MTFEIEVGGRGRSVSVQRTGGTLYRVVIDGRARMVDARRAGEFGLLLTAETFPAKVSSVGADKSNEDTGLGRQTAEGDGQGAAGASQHRQAPTYEVFVAPAGTVGDVFVTLEGRTALVGVNGRRTRRAADTARQTDGEQPVVAPMPGRVVRVLVAPGDEVVAKQAVVVVEAMKMENELRAPKGGRVKDVSVSAGASVEAGRVLVVIE